MNPFIVLKNAAGITEAGFAGKRNDAGLVGMVGAGIFGESKFLRITAGEHFVDGVDGVIRDGLFVFGQNRVPMILKNLTDRDFAG